MSCCSFAIVIIAIAITPFFTNKKKESNIGNLTAQQYIKWTEQLEPNTNLVSVALPSVVQQADVLKIKPKKYKTNKYFKVNMLERI